MATPAPLPPSHAPLRLANGARVARVRGDGASAFVGFGLWWRAGSRFEEHDESGWAHLMEHLWFRGGGRFTAADVDRTTDRLGGAVNAETGREIVGLHGLAPAGDADLLEELLLDLFLAPAFTAADLALERRLIGAEAAAAEADPLQAAIDRAFSTCFPCQSLGRSIVGRADALAAATPTSLQRWRAERLGGQRIAVALLGPWRDAAIDTIATRLVDLPGGGPVPGDTPVPSARTVSGCARATGPHLWAFSLPGFADPRFSSAELLMEALAGGLSGLLPGRLRRETGLAYDARAWIEPAFDVSVGMILVDSSSSRAIAETERHLDAVAAGGLPGGVVENVLIAARARFALTAADPVGSLRRLGWETLAETGHRGPPDRHALRAPWPELAVDRRQRLAVGDA